MFFKKKFIDILKEEKEKANAIIKECGLKGTFEPGKAYHFFIFEKPISQNEFKKLEEMIREKYKCRIRTFDRDEVKDFLFVFERE